MFDRGFDAGPHVVECTAVIEDELRGRDRGLIDWCANLTAEPDIDFTNTRHRRVDLGCQFVRQQSVDLSDVANGILPCSGLGADRAVEADDAIDFVSATNLSAVAAFC